MQGVSMPRAVTVVRATVLLLPLLLPTIGNSQTWETGRIDLARFYPVDLQARANQKRVDDFHQNNLPGNNLVELASGKHQLLGIPFQVGDSVLQLGSAVLKGMPERIEIKVGKKFTKLHVLHATAYGVNEGQVTIGSYTFRYEDGKSQTIPVVNGKDVCGWWKRPDAPDPSPAKIGWEGSNKNVKQTGTKIRLFVSTWENPRPGTSVVRIDFASAMTNCAPFCVAMTVANPLELRAPLKPLTAVELGRLWTQLASDGTPACDAVEALAGAPTQAISFLGPRVHVARPTADAKKVATLITKLDHDRFADREMATAELEKLGLEALPQLRRTMDDSKSSEIRQRTQGLLEKLKNVSLTPDQKRLQAVLYVFELIESDEARKVLDEVASGKAGLWLAAEAEASLKRLQKKRKPGKV
jgi:hypothetical protein